MSRCADGTCPPEGFETRRSIDGTLTVHAKPRARIPAGALPLPLVPCGFKVGDRVIYTNDYGVEFEQTVVGFAPESDLLFQYGKHVYCDSPGAAYWCAKHPDSLKLA